MARTVNQAAIESELETLEAEIGKLKAIEPLEGVRIKWVRPAGTAGKPSQKKGYPRLIHADGTSRNIQPLEAASYQKRIEAGRELRRLGRRREQLAARLA
ncbi:MAG: hypothetical protein HC860_18660 [Alkalinema sp. RU_4_3]|nr:hypothetical protein [Alkalinema sp. RU_4_3]NJR70440.1 hypothetical protein [Synechococcales cyanobacterium CRU_2_2]